MQALILLTLFAILTSSAYSQEKSPEEKWEMKSYYFVLLTKGPNRNHDSLTAVKIQQEHLENIGRLAEMGKIQAAGPFLDDSDWRGIFIFDAESVEEVEQLLQTDSAIKSGRLSYTIKPWMTAKGTCLE